MTHSGVQHIMCSVFVYFFFSLYTKYFQFLCIFQSWLHLRSFSNLLIRHLFIEVPSQESELTCKYESFMLIRYAFQMQMILNHNIDKHIHNITTVSMRIFRINKNKHTCCKSSSIAQIKNQAKHSKQTKINQIKSWRTISTNIKYNEATAVYLHADQQPPEPFQDCSRLLNWEKLCSVRNGPADCSTV